MTIRHEGRQRRVREILEERKTHHTSQELAEEKADIVHRRLFLSVLSKYGVFVLKCAILTGVIIALATIFIYFWHILAPEHKRWLSPEKDILRIETFLSSIAGFLGGVALSSHLNRLFRPLVDMDNRD